MAELGLQLPPVTAPVGAYTSAIRTGSLVYTSGQIPLVDGAIASAGQAGGGAALADAKAAARVCALNTLAAVDGLVGLDAIVRIIKVTGFVASTPDFADQSQVINGASELYQEIFGDAGVHARSAVGVAALPRGVTVEVELIAEVR
jgi:enamine deaminase RidA (YjgF/YER057c/UK114 family)